MATREQVYEQALTNFSRSLSARSTGSNQHRYNDNEEDGYLDEDDLIVDNLVNSAKIEKRDDRDSTDDFGFTDPLEPELIGIKSVPANDDDYDDQHEEEGVDGDEENDPYLNPLCKTAISVGSSNLGYSRAKMLGLCDNEGNVKLGTSGVIQPISAATKQRLDKMSKPREIDVEYIMDGVDNEENEARLRAKREAQKAMNNPKCGYDFVSRLKDRGDFLDRAGDKGGKGAEKARLDIEEQDYNARLDKLACPKCKRTQTFDEYHEKRRFCSQCKEKFTKINLCNANTFEKRMKEAAKAKEEKIAALDAQVYKPDNKSKKYVVGVGVVSVDENGKVKSVSRRGSSESQPVNPKLGPKVINVISELAETNSNLNKGVQQMIGVTKSTQRPPSGTKPANTLSEEDLTAQKFKKLAMYDGNSAPLNQTAPSAPTRKR